MNTGGNRTGGPATVCKICWCNVYSFQPTGWNTGRHPGIAHRECLDAEQVPAPPGASK